MEIGNIKYPGSIVYFSSDCDRALERISHLGFLGRPR